MIFLTERNIYETSNANCLQKIWTDGIAEVSILPFVIKSDFTSVIRNLAGLF